MQTVKGMAEAHLNSVQKTISDLEQQKSVIDEEISKLQDYLQKGVEVLNQEADNNS